MLKIYNKTSLLYQAYHMQVSFLGPTFFCSQLLRNQYIDMYGDDLTLHKSDIVVNLNWS
jgi:hypothetical protein